MPALQARKQVVGRQVDQLDLVGLVEDPVGDRLLLPDAGDAGDHVVQALEVLNVERRPDADARVEQLLDVLPALGVARPRFAFGDIRMGELIDENDRRRAPQRGVEIEFAARDAAVADLEERQLLEPLEQALGLRAPVRLDIADDDIGAAARAPRAASSIE